MADIFVPTERFQMNTNVMTMRQAMTLLFGDIDRQGPGDDTFTKKILARLPHIPKKAQIADLGCGTGAGGLLLAQHYQQPVLCVDIFQKFLQTLDTRAQNFGVEALINTMQADMGNLDPRKYQFDLLWSEGAAYNLTFDVAIKKWRPLMAKNGIAVVSEMSWFSADRPQKALEFWDEAYPQLASEKDNLASVAKHGFEVLFTERLPASSWWKYYYDPLLDKADILAMGAPKALQEAIAEIRWETDVFREFSDYFGYTFYGLKAI